MGIFSKVWKGIKKVGKKIGKGIKKVFGKVASAFGKLGIVGQLALGFLMPYALGALSNFAGAALGKVGTWSATLMKSSNLIAKTVGYGLKAVHVAGTTIGNMYTSITETLSAGVDKAKDFFGFGPTETVDLAAKATSDISNISIVDGKAVIGNTTNPLLKGNSVIMKDMPIYSAGTDVIATEATSLLAPTTSSIIDAGKSAVDSFIPTADIAGGSAVQKVTEKATTNILQDVASGTKELFSDINVFDSGSKIRQDVANFSAYDYAKTTATGAVDEAFTGGAVAAGQQKVASALGYKVPNSNQTYINLPEMQGAGRNVGKYNEATLWAQSNGNNFLTQSFRPRDYVSEAFGMASQDTEYFKTMQSFQPVGG